MNAKTAEILLVEDNPYDVELMMKALQKHNLADRVYTVRDGMEALQFIFATDAFAERDVLKPPKVILLDLKLPKLDGLEVLKRIKADDRTRNIPVVILTNSQQKTDITQSYQLGVNIYIVKPVEFDKFLKVIGEQVPYWLSSDRKSEPPGAFHG